MPEARGFSELAEKTESAGPSTNPIAAPPQKNYLLNTINPLAGV